MNLAELGAAFHMPCLSLEEMRACAPAFDLVPYPEAARRGCAALRAPQGEIHVVLADPFDRATQDWLDERIRDPFAYRIADRAEIDAWLVQQEDGLRALEGISVAADGVAQRSNAQDLSIEAITEVASPVMRLVDSTLHDALKCGASDVHLEVAEGGLAIKYRIDGVLGTVKTVEDSATAEQIISRIKVMSELDIAEQRVPQDGRLRVRYRSREIDLRVSVMPGVHGENAVLRILDKRALGADARGLTLEQLGFEPTVMAQLRRLSLEPHGMLLVTGPTGSGKTTTLYAVISEVNRGRDKIVTIEDPVEYQLPGVLQIPVNEQKGLTFARGLRSILRHDPDRIMVGEIRDPETAEIAVQSALTGHLVYTTVHANNVLDVLGRFLHMGIDAFSLASALNGVVAQRLVRIFCKACVGRGCGDCRGIGFRGRKAIAELVVLNDDLKDMIAERAPMRALKVAARAAGTRTLREAAMALVGNGETSQEEIDHVTGVDH